MNSLTAKVCLAAVCFTSCGCSLLYPYPDLTPEQNDVLCSDGIDNDGNGHGDCEDTGCRAYCQEETYARCRDGVDNDLDGSFDCDERSCRDFCLENEARTCGDGIDNDVDGDSDCEDVDCAGFCPELSPGDCSDAIDNDGDGTVDTGDPSCWPVFPPRVQRCTGGDGSDFSEYFDGYLANDWIQWPDGTIGPETLFTWGERPERDGERADAFGKFVFNTTGEATLSNNLASLATRVPIAGSWTGFRMTFAALVPGGTLLRVALVPADLVADAPPPGSESSGLTLTLNGASSPPTFSLGFQGAIVSEELPVARSLCGGVACEDEFGEVSVELDAQGFHARLTMADGDQVELRAPETDAGELPASRLVVWGGSISQDTAAWIDDLKLQVAPNRPCGIETPQIRDRCSNFRGFGQTLAVAGDRGGLCALVAATELPDALEPNALSVWHSNDGKEWQPAVTSQEPLATLSLPAAPIGGALTRDSDDWRIAVAYRERKGVRLAFASSHTCGGFSELVPGPLLFEDAEAPSYLVREGRHEVYFTRPPTDQTHRSLWRASGSDVSSIELEPHPLAELPSEVAVPTNIVRVGTHDLVLTHPTVPVATVSGVGMLVSENGGGTWQPVPPSLWLEAGKASFDDRGVISAALAWDGESGTLLYGGSSDRGVAAATAQVVANDQLLPEPEPADSCGNGVCDAGESCTSCNPDCECTGVAFENPLTAPSELVSGSDSPMKAIYVDRDATTLHWSIGGDPTWWVAPLDVPIDADFELSFDVASIGEDANGTFVGLGSMQNLGLGPLGIFGVDGVPWVHTQTEWFLPTGLDGYLSWGTGHVTLRRVGSTVSVDVSRDGECTFERTAIDYVDSLGPLTHLIVGVAPVPSNPSVLAAGYFSADYGTVIATGTFRHLALRLLDDPEECPKALQHCDMGGGHPACIDTSLNPNHCGGCGQACAPAKQCVLGTCQNLLIDCNTPLAFLETSDDPTTLEARFDVSRLRASNTRVCGQQVDATIDLLFSPSYPGEGTLSIAFTGEGTAPVLTRTAFGEYEQTSFDPVLCPPQICESAVDTFEFWTDRNYWIQLGFDEFDPTITRGELTVRLRIEEAEDDG